MLKLLYAMITGTAITASGLDLQQIHHSAVFVATNQFLPCSALVFQQILNLSELYSGLGKKCMLHKKKTIQFMVNCILQPCNNKVASLCNGLCLCSSQQFIPGCYLLPRFVFLAAGSFLHGIYSFPIAESYICDASILQ